MKDEEIPTSSLSVSPRLGSAMKEGDRLRASPLQAHLYNSGQVEWNLVPRAGASAEELVFVFAPVVVQQDIGGSPSDVV